METKHRIFLFRAWTVLSKTFTPKPWGDTLRARFNRYFLTRAVHLLDESIPEELIPKGSHFEVILKERASLRLQQAEDQFMRDFEKRNPPIVAPEAPSFFIGWKDNGDDFLVFSDN